MSESGTRTENHCANSAHHALTPFQTGRLYGRLQRWTVTWRWHQDVYDQVVHQPALYRHENDAQEQQLKKAALWPPGGFASSMARCEICGHWTPPQTVGSAGICLDCYYTGLPVHVAASLPSAITAFTRLPDRDAHQGGVHAVRKRIRRVLPRQLGRRVRVRCPKRRLEIEADQVLGAEFVLQEELLDDGQVQSALLPIPEPRELPLAA